MRAVTGFELFRKTQAGRQTISVLAAAWRTLSDTDREAFRHSARSQPPVPTKPKKVAGPKKRKRRKKDPLAPKGRRSAFLYYFMERLPALLLDGNKVTRCVQLAAKDWKALSCRKDYEDRAATDKERFYRQMAQYKTKIA